MLYVWASPNQFVSPVCCTLYVVPLCCLWLEVPAGGPAPGGVRAANLTEATRPYLEEVALNEQVIDACVLLRRPILRGSGRFVALVERWQAALCQIMQGVLCSSVVGLS